MQVTKTPIFDFNIPYGVIVRQDTVVRDALNKTLRAMERLK